MSWKEFFLGAAISASPAAAQETPSADSTGSEPKIEQVESQASDGNKSQVGQKDARLEESLKKIRADAEAKFRQKSEQLATDSLKRSATLMEAELKTQMKKMAEKAAQKTPEQIGRENFEAAKFDALTVLAMSEGFKDKAYGGGPWYIGWGCSVKANGKKVCRGSRLKSGKEAQNDTYKAFEQKYYALKKYLPLDKMTRDEIAVFTNLAYHHGEGCLGSNGKPSEVVAKFIEYKEHPSPVTKKALRNAYIGKNKKFSKRKDFEARILLGEIKIDNEGTSTDPTAVNLAAARIDLNNIKALPQSSEELVKIIETKKVIPSVNDTINNPLSASLGEILQRENSNSNAAGHAVSPQMIRRAAANSR